MKAENRLNRALDAVHKYRERQRDGVAETLAEFLQHHGDLKEQVAALLDITVPSDGDDGLSVSGDDRVVEPTVFGRFKLLELLGQGGMGSVYLAVDEQLDRRVAIKQIRPEHIHHGQARLRFQREARTLSRLDHPNLCKVFEAGQVEGTPYLVMQYVEGQSLKEKLEAEWPAMGSSPIPTSGSSAPSTRDEIMAVAGTIETIARALHHAHENGVVHRDVKPGNVMIKPDGQPVVLDFGLVRVETGQDLTVTGSSQQLGTPFYMAPEQIVPAGRRPGPGIDVWALGVTLYECLTLQRPFGAATRHELFQRILNDTPSDIGRLNRELPRDLRVIVETAIAKEPELRYVSALEFAEDLRRIRHFEPIRARRPRVSVRTWRWAQRNRLAASFLLLLSGTMLAIAFLWWNAVELASAERVARNGEAHQRKAAQESLDRFNLLSVVVKLNAVDDAVEGLRPAWPEKIPVMEKWLRDQGGPLAKELPLVRRARQELEHIALPQSAEERRADREGHPNQSDYERLKAKVASLQLAMDVRLGTRAPPKSELPTDAPSTAFELNSLIADRVSLDPEERIWGEESLAVTLARRALAIAPMKHKPVYLNNLAWACFGVGLDKEAKQYCEAAVAAADDGSKSVYRETQQKLRKAIESAPAELVNTKEVLAELSIALDQRQTWTFKSLADGFLYDTLQAVEQRLKSFLGETGALAETRRRLGWARRIEALSFSHPKAPISWQAAAAAIARADGVVASKLYSREYHKSHPIHIEPQMGLIPIGMNPLTSLWEFYHLASAKDPEAGPPSHDANGHLTVTESSGIVFVLVPGGTSWLGAQMTAKTGPNYDKQAGRIETPYEVTLSPFFMARHELTQGQWFRLSRGGEPSNWKPGFRIGEMKRAIDRTHPVEHVNWHMSHKLLVAHGLQLPTESQWEYACRAGTTTPWWTGQERGSLILNGLAVNLADQFAKRCNAKWEAIADWPNFDDGFLLHAPVDAMRPNPWGLFHVHGNVGEWCRDRIGPVDVTPRPGDGLRVPPPNLGGVGHVHRGGGYDETSRYARSAMRLSSSPTVEHGALGLRAARPLLPASRRLSLSESGGPFGDPDSLGSRQNKRK
jgi:serine/threonine protein kinase/formylglycine-generating enzyme required for sulfatase activity